MLGIPFHVSEFCLQFILSFRRGKCILHLVWDKGVEEITEVLTVDSCQVWHANTIDCAFSGLEIIFSNDEILQAIGFTIKEVHCFTTKLKGKEFSQLLSRGQSVKQLY